MLVSLKYGLKHYRLNPVLEQIYQFRFESIITDFSNPSKTETSKYTRFVNITLLEQNEIKAAYQLFTKKMIINDGEVVQNGFLIKQLCYAFDELIIVINYKGKIIQVHNIKEVKKRWEIDRLELIKDYEGYEAENYFSAISDLLNNEDDLIAYLSDYKMFGLYFHSLFGTNKLWELPIIREKTLQDYAGKTITESINPEKREAVVYPIIGTVSTESKPIENGFDKYEGMLTYDDYQLQEAYLETESEQRNIKYGILLIG